MVNAWAGLGHVVGAGVRRIGTVRTDMAPEERRDGGALVWLVLAVLIAAVEWWNLRGVDATFISMPASWVHAVVGGTFGFMALVLPVFCLFFAWRAFRHPTEVQANNRIAIGLMALTVAGSGIAHIAGGQPQLNQGFEAIWRAGGFVGFLAADPLSALVTHWGALAVLAVLAFLSLLVMTATPIGQIGPRLREGYNKLMGQSDPRSTDVSDPEHDRSYLDPARPEKKRGKRQTRAERRREKAQLDATTVTKPSSAPWSTRPSDAKPLKVPRAPESSTFPTATPLRPVPRRRRLGCGERPGPGHRGHPQRATGRQAPHQVSDRR